MVMINIFFLNWRTQSGFGML